MTVATYDELIARAGSVYYANWPFYGDQATTAGLFGGNTYAISKAAEFRTMPSLPAGVSKYIVTGAQCAVGNTSTPETVMICRVINLGQLDISGPTYTDANAFPTVTELGASNNTFGPIVAEITTALNSTPGSITVTYVDQDGNAAETTTAQTLPTTNNGIRVCGLINLNSTDIGARDITTATRTGGTTPTGVIKFWGLLPICMMNSLQNGCFSYSFLSSAFNWATLGASNEIGAFAMAGTTSTAARGHLGCLNLIGDST